MAKTILSVPIFAAAGYCVYLAIRGPVRDILTREAKKLGLVLAGIFLAVVILACAAILVCLGLYFLRIGG